MGGLISLVLLILASVGLALVLRIFISPFPLYGWALALITPPALLTLGFAISTALKNRKRPARSIPDFAPYGAATPEDGQSMEPIPDPDHPGQFICPKCKSPLFEAVPGKTTRDEIIRFVQSTNIFGDNPDAADGWIHPGVYCPKGCIWIRAEYPLGLDDL